MISFKSYYAHAHTHTIDRLLYTAAKVAGNKWSEETVTQYNGLTLSLTLWSDIEYTVSRPEATESLWSPSVVFCVG